MQALKQLKIGTWTVLPFEGIHDVPVLGFLIMNEQKERLLFLIDTVYCRYRFKTISHIMIGINYCEDMLRKNIQKGIINTALGRRIMQTHCGLKTAVDFLKINVCSATKEIHVLHCSESNLDKAKAKTEIQKLTGKVVYI
ncbi:hypothetical protein KA005_41475 [bacterium]|nr:hypothetical protein [bacterium]